MSDEAGAGTRPRIIIDCDPGHDDAIAIVVAAHTCDLVGITTVAGNAPLERTTLQRPRDARAARHRRSRALRAARPLLAEPFAAGDVHGASGLDGAALPPPTRTVDSDDAVAFIIDCCRNQPGTWIVAVGPLTNVALALRRAPGPRRFARRNLGDGRRHVRQPHRCRRIQRLGRPGGRRDRVRLRRSAGHGGTRRHPPVPRHGATHRPHRRHRRAAGDDAGAVCSRSSARRTRAATTPSRGRRCTTCSPSSPSPSPRCSSGAAATSPSRLPGC